MRPASTLSRRSWLRNSLLSAGGALLLPGAKEKLLSDREDLVAQLARLDPEDESYWNFVKKHFTFDLGLTYFNNASLGATPDMVHSATNEFRKTLDAYPSKYMWGDWDDEKENVRNKIAELMHVSPEEIALTHNTTEGMNLIASSLELQAGDEVIVGNHEHHTAYIPWVYYQERKGVKLVRPTLPLIPADKEELVDVYRKAITPKTKVISIVHITNTNGMILPVKEICAMAKERGILVGVDGAQSMAMIDFDLDDLGCDFYAASGHKWLFSPKGMGVFYARRSAQSHLKPLIVCRSLREESIRRLENYNTRNLPELLGMGMAVDYHQLIGVKRREERIYALKHYFLSKIASEKQFVLKTPTKDDMSAGILNVEVLGKRVFEVKDQLFNQYGIDCRPMSSHQLNGLRISLSIYNTLSDIDYLADAMKYIAE